MELPQQLRSASSHTARLDRTLKVLQDRVKEQEAVLEELRASSEALATEPSSDSRSHILQLHALKVAYESITPLEPWLPTPESPLPALLALRSTGHCIKESQECAIRDQNNLKEVEKRLEKEQADLSDARLIQASLQSRISSLQEKVEERTQKSPGLAARDMIKEAKSKGAFYDRETGKLVTAFNVFIDDHLASMLVTEELGGPIVGETVGVSEDVLAAGQGIRGKGGKVTASAKDTKRQQRIDEIWGPNPKEEPWDGKWAAAEEMRELTEQLLNSLVEADGYGPGSYIELPRESAAARFLVRSKVALFHPKDARKLRLVDFGGEIDG